VAIAALLTASCSDDEKLGPDPIAPAPTSNYVPSPDASTYYDVAACKACVAKNCTAERVRCFNVDGCVQIANCTTQLNKTESGVYQCSFQQTALGRREYDALSACEFEASCNADACRDVCGNSDLCTLRSAPAGNTPPPSTPFTCGDCVHARCPEAVTKCEPGTACSAYYACTVPCPDRTTCVAACDAKEAQGKADAKALLDCEQNSCKEQCVY
jgi:hypothetical protein